MEGDLSLFQTIVIAIVEGLTEFLPVSSTGHMIITQHILGVESTDFVKAFTFIIQFGAILSVVCLYWKNFFHLNHTPMPENCTPVKRFLHKYDFYWKLLVAFIPAAVLGLLFSDMIDAMLESVTVVAVMLIAGGIFMLFCDKIFGNGSEKTVLTEKKILFYRIIPMYFYDTGSITLHGDNCRRYGTKTYPKESSRILFFSGCAHHVCSYSV